jgi:hypothetical protein
MAGDRVARSVSKFIYIRVGGQILRIYPPLNKPKTLCTMPRGQSSGHRALAHLLAAHSIATPKQAKEPILTTRNGGQLDGQEKGIRTEYFSTCH